MLKVPAEILAHIPPATEPDARPLKIVPVVSKPDPVRTTPPAQEEHIIKHVVVDAGHGGHDAGAVRAGMREKDINLEVSLTLAAELRRRGMRVTLTRSTDVFLTLDRRSQIANTCDADLFISVHTNTAPARTANGIEVFYLPSTFTDNRRSYNDVARAPEINRASGLYGSKAVTPGLLTRRRAESRRLAQWIEEALVSRLRTRSRGIKQGRFSVLKWTAVPAVLVEVGFLSNTYERRRLAGSPYRQRIALSLADAVISYRNEYDRTHSR